MSAHLPAHTAGIDVAAHPRRRAQCYPDMEQPTFALRYSSAGDAAVAPSTLGSLAPPATPVLAAWTAQLFEHAGSAVDCTEAYTLALDADRGASNAADYQTRVAGGQGGVGSCQIGGVSGSALGAPPPADALERLTALQKTRDGCEKDAFTSVMMHFALPGFDLGGAIAAAAAAHDAAAEGILGRYTSAAVPDRLLAPIEQLVLMSVLGPASYFALPPWQANLQYICANASVVAVMGAAYPPAFISNVCAFAAAPDVMRQLSFTAVPGGKAALDAAVFGDWYGALQGSFMISDWTAYHFVTANATCVQRLPMLP